MRNKIQFLCGVLMAAISVGAVSADVFSENKIFEWSLLADLPDPVGRSGMFVGVHNGALIVAGGTNFPEPVWDSDKQWYDDIFVLTQENGQWQWAGGFSLPGPRAYGAVVSTRYGVLCMGGSDGKRIYDEVFLLSWDPVAKTIQYQPLASLPQPCAYSAAVRIDEMVYLAGGMYEEDLHTAMDTFWSLDLSALNSGGAGKWQVMPSWPGPSRAFNLIAAQHNGYEYCVYVMSGRRISDTEHSGVEFLTDVYEFSPSAYRSEKALPWRKRADLPRSVMAGAAIEVGQSHILVLSGDDGSLWGQAEALKDTHPGFPKRALAYHTITNTWVDAGPIPANQVTTPAVRWSDAVNSPIILAGGEIRPRVRTPKIWSIVPQLQSKTFGAVDFSVIGLYLLLMVGVGAFFAFRNKSSDDFFRGGQRVPWFVAGLSIFATMLSSITFLAIPAKAYMTDWVFLLVNMMVVAVTPFVISYFLPFFRKIDATSAYEYLEKRFNRFVRLFASASFILFQIGRMAVVMYLPALALAAITPLTEIQCILIMGVLSIIYCTLGGLEGVVWTDTIQSVVLFGGAILALGLIVTRLDGGLESFFELAAADHKFHLVNWDFSASSITTASLWVVLLGGIGQSLVPYSSDMAVIQRYMSVATIERA
ncbi:MAG: sodium:solute symporter, partial [Planctomycetes bacterium]|nr:sodium:solute symporter [Planctomycetota bacterium]